MHSKKEKDHDLITKINIGNTSNLQVEDRFEEQTNTTPMVLHRFSWKNRELYWEFYRMLENKSCKILDLYWDNNGELPTKNYIYRVPKAISPTIRNTFFL